MDGSVAEDALWRRALAGDAAAFGLIFDLHRDRIFRHSFRILRNHDDAEDACGVAFLELWRRRAKVREVDGSVLPWLLATTTNVCRNLDRSRRRYQRLMDALPHGEPHPSAEESALPNLVSGSDVSLALSALSASDAELFTLVALEGYSVVDAARALGLSAGAARTRLHRLRGTLKEHLGHTTLTGYLTEEAAT